MAKIAVLGHGVVGSGVAELLEMNHSSISDKAGEVIEIKKILDLRDFNDLPYSQKFTKNFDDILNDPEISVVVEVMGGLRPAYDYVKASLNAKKSVVTSNKELVAEKGAELLEVAKNNNVNFFFEASVGGGIPIIRPMHMCLAANKITEIAGILNGTTNFILTKMIREHMQFDEALKLAQQLGYAERNPAADVEGLDACRKICILSALAFGKHVYPQFVYTEGITQITLDDVAYAESFDSVIKLIGCAKLLDDGKLFVMVSPAFIKCGSQLSSIEDVFNGILVRGDATGDVVFYGKGAGKLPTASAVVADVIDAVKAPGTNASLHWSDSDDADYVVDYKGVPLSFFVRCRSEQAGLKEKLQSKINVKEFLMRADMPDGECAFITEPICEKELEQILGSCEHVQVLSKIRVFDY